jgi:hypothetical protein
VAAAATLLALALGRGSPAGVELRLVVSGRARVTAEPGGRSCRAQCRFVYRRGTRVRLRVLPAGGVRFRGWGGACSGDDCTVPLGHPRTVIARFDGSSELRSWSTFTGCRPVKTTIAKIVGARTGADGAPLERGGGFQPHLRGAQLHLLRPPCALRGTRTLVELDDVAISGPVIRAADGDVVAHLLDTRSSARNPFLRTLRAEIDATWLRAGAALRDFPAQPARIDVQGFVYWNTGHGVGEPPEPSGWELHPVSAWLPAAG